MGLKKIQVAEEDHTARERLVLLNELEQWAESIKDGGRLKKGMKKHAESVRKGYDVW